MLKQKVSGTIQEVILPDFPDDDNTVTTTVTKSRRVSFGPNFVKEFIVDSAITGQCMAEYEQPFPSSDSSNADSSHSAVGHSTFVVHEKSHRAESAEERPKPPKFASTICFSADSPTADMEFTEGCITLAKSILDKKNKEMTVFIQAKPKEGEKAKEEDTNYFEGSQFEMSVTKCLKSKENSRQQERRFAGEKTRMFGKYEDEMSMTICEKLFMEEREREREGSWEESKENRMPLDAIMRHLDKDSSDSDLFNPERSFGKLLGTNPFELSGESENLNLNESMEISGEAANSNPLEKSTTGFSNFQPSFDKSDAMLSGVLEVKNNSDVGENPPSFIREMGKEGTMEEAMDISDVIESAKMEVLSEKVGVDEDIQSEVADRNRNQSLMYSTSEDIPQEIDDISVDIQSQQAVDISIGMPSDNPLEAQTEKSEIQMDVEPERTGDVCVDVEAQKSDEGVEVESEKAVDVSAILRSEDVVHYQSERGDIESDMVLENEGENLVNDQPEKSEIGMNIESEKVEESSTNMQSEEAVSIQKEKSEMSMELEKELDVDMEKEKEKETTAEISNTNDITDGSVAVHRSMTEENFSVERIEKQGKADEESVSLSDSSSEKSTLLADLKVVESLKEQSKEEGCTWSLKEFRHPGKETEGMLSFGCCLLESTTSLNFTLKMSKEDSFDSCSMITDSRIHLDEEKQWRLPEYSLAVEFGFNQLKKYFEERRQHVETLRLVPYFLDQVNSFLSKVNGYLRQIHSVLTSYPGSRLTGSVLSFRLFSFPVFFSCTVSVDLGTMYRLSRSSLSFDHDFGCLDERKVGDIFEECLKRENSLCEFVVLSTKYLVEMEKPLGCVSKRGHIRLLPEELKS